MRIIAGFSSLLVLGTLALAVARPRTAAAQGRAPLRVTAGDLGVARKGFTDLLAQSNQASKPLVGMPGPDEQARANLGAPLPLAMIGLDRLRAYQPGTAVDGLIDHLSVVVYPVQVDQDVRAEMEMVLQGGTWQTVRVGAPSHARELAKLSKIQGAAAYLLRVPALGVEFLAYPGVDTLRLVLVHDAPDVGLPVGRALPAQDVMRVLAPLARAYRDDLFRQP